MAATKLTYNVIGPLHRTTYPDHINKSMDTFLERSENEDASVIIGPLNRASDAFAGRTGTRIAKR